MKIRKTIRKLKHFVAPPCPKCPYTLGYVKFVKDPCWECKMNNYNMYYILMEQMISGTAKLPEEV